MILLGKGWGGGGGGGGGRVDFEIFNPNAHS